MLRSKFLKLFASNVWGENISHHCEGGEKNKQLPKLNRSFGKFNTATAEGSSENRSIV
jgi:hypothetical protein